MGFHQQTHVFFILGVFFYFLFSFSIVIYQVLLGNGVGGLFLGLRLPFSYKGMNGEAAVA